MQPIFVIGPGRCGTSSTARVLHEHFRVNMGRHFRPPNEANPDGYYEDFGFKLFNEFLVDGKITEDSWFTTIRELISLRNEKGEPWGLKDPRMCYLLPKYLLMCPNAQLIRCRRKLEDVARSCRTHYGWNDSIVIEREERLDQYTKGYPVLELDFTEFRPDEWIIEQLEGRIQNGS